ncbi:helix-turn-helix transcriptional regulator [Lentzea sp. NPDC059081]|uniref:helix-turn-helix transcriptional regulator n=1 Tax=Lentzea sp. NPDC059081 TaxID=3346719 RepID=UPI0036CEDEAB
MIDRPGLADFLRRRRELLRPDDIGRGVRRTPGLRRDEVAELASISADYYARLEQSRGANPSEPIVAALAVALRCDLDERDHLYHLAGFTPPPRMSGGRVRPGVMMLLDHLQDVPACVVSDLSETLWQNALADLAFGPLPDSGAGRARNFLWRWFTDPDLRAWFPREDWPRQSLSHVLEMRAAHARRGGDPDVTGLVRDLLAVSEEFRALWERHEVAVRLHDRKRVVHPQVGVLHLTCEVLLSPEQDTKVLVFFPTEGTDAREKLDRLQRSGVRDVQMMR